MNSEMNLFNPVDLELSRSTFEYHPTLSGTCNAGRLVPVFFTEILPGDSVKMDLRTLIKMCTPVYPTMDQLYADVFFFFVPNRLVLGDRYGNPTATDSNHSWAAIIGAQSNLVGAPIPASGLTVPTIKFDYHAAKTRPAPQSLVDYFVGNTDLAYVSGANPSVYVNHAGYLNCLPFLSYFAIWNEDFRDESTTTPVTWSYDNDNVVVPTGSVPLYASKTEADYRGSMVPSNYALVNSLGDGLSLPDAAVDDAFYWLPFPTYRFHGYFGSALPWPQRNSAGVELPLGDAAPVFPMDTTTWQIDRTLATKLEWMGLVNGAANVQGALFAGGPTSGQSGTSVDSTDSTIGDKAVIPANLFADLRQATAANVNALRAAIQKQRWYEKLARSGNRFDELEYGLFGVRPHDSGLDRPLYLGGKRIPLQIEMVASTNGNTTATSGSGAGSLGALGAFSHTNDKDHMFYHSFDEWGTLMCVMTIRHHDTFSGGLPRKLTRKTRDDYYFPTFAHLGEQPILVKEISTEIKNSGQIVSDKVFGFQQAWEEYRQEQDRSSGFLSSGTTTLRYMMYAVNYLGNIDLATFLNASHQIVSVDQTLAVSSLTSGFQFIYQFTFDYTMRRCMPTYSVPGLMDHF